MTSRSSRTRLKRDKELLEKDLTIDRLLDAIRVQEDSFTKLRTSIICMEDEHRISEMASQQQKECLEELTKAREELEAQVQALMKESTKPERESPRPVSMWRR